jgi:hypothetical protein
MKTISQTTHYLEIDGQDAEIPFVVQDTPFEHLSPDKLKAVVACLAQNFEPLDPIVEWDEGFFVQFDRKYIHYAPRPDVDDLKRLIRENPGRVFLIHSKGDGYYAPRAPLTVKDSKDKNLGDWLDDADGYYILPADVTDPKGYTDSCLQTYSAFCSGDVYGIVCWSWTRTSVDSPWIFVEDSRDSECWGFYGYDYALEELKNLFESEVKTCQ